jgi:hypothetical protein
MLFFKTMELGRAWLLNQFKALALWFEPLFTNQQTNYKKTPTE